MTGGGDGGAGRRDPAAPPPRLVALDVDGTLLTSAHALAPSTVAAVDRVRGRGVEVVLTSSRPPRALWPILAALGLVEPAEFVASQGALTGSYAADGTLRVRDRRPMPVGPARALVASAPDGVAVSWFREERWLVDRMDALVAQEAAIVGCAPEVAVLADEVAGPDKLLLLAPADRTGLLRAVVVPDGLLAVASTPTHLEVTGAGIDKVGALARLCARRGIVPARVAAMGDGRNDLAMLRFAGLAVAPANAVPEVRAIADLVVSSNDEDAVAEALAALVP